MERIGILSRRWPGSSKVLVIGAVACGLLAFLMVRGYAARIEAMDPGRPTTISVAGRDLARGTVIDASMVRLRQMPAAYVPPGAVSSSRDLVGRVLIAPVEDGEPLTQTRVSEAGGGEVAGLVPAGLRAVLVPSSLPVGAVRPGDHVDVIAAASGTGGYSQVVGSAVEVVRVVAPGPSGEGSLIVLAAPEQATEIAQAAAVADTVAITVLGAGDLGVDSFGGASPSPAPPG